MGSLSRASPFKIGRGMTECHVIREALATGRRSHECRVAKGTAKLLELLQGLEGQKSNWTPFSTTKWDWSLMTVGFLDLCHASGESCFRGLASWRKHSTLASHAVKHMPNMAIRILGKIFRVVDGRHK